jgi:hypothetical protein
MHHRIGWSLRHHAVLITPITLGNLYFDVAVG